MTYSQLILWAGAALGTVAGVCLLGAMASRIEAEIEDASSSAPSTQPSVQQEHQQTPPQHHQRDAHKESYAQKQKPRPQQGERKGFLLEQAKELSNSGDVVMIQQMIAELENQIERGKEVGADVKDARDARSLLIGRLKNLPQADLSASREAQELRVRLGEAMH